MNKPFDDSSKKVSIPALLIEDFGNALIKHKVLRIPLQYSYIKEYLHQCISYCLHKAEKAQQLQPQLEQHMALLDKEARAELAQIVLSYIHNDSYIKEKFGEISGENKPAMRQKIS